MTRVLGVDAGTFVGLAYVDPQSPRTIVGTCVNFPDLRGWPRLDALAHGVRRVIEEWEPSVIMVEAYAIHHLSSAVTVISCGTIVRQVLYNLGFRWTEVPPTVLKRWVTGSGAANKDEMALAVKTRFGYSSSSDDIVDAVALAQLGLHLGVVGTDPSLKGLSEGWD